MLFRSINPVGLRKLANKKPRHEPALRASKSDMKLIAESENLDSNQKQQNKTTPTENENNNETSESVLEDQEIGGLNTSRKRNVKSIHICKNNEVNPSILYLETTPTHETVTGDNEVGTVHGGIKMLLKLEIDNNQRRCQLQLRRVT